MARSKHTIEQKYKAIQMLTNEGFTWHEVCEKYQISPHTLNQWRKKYETQGTQGLKESNSWTSYSSMLKEAAVHDFLNEGLSKEAIVLKYQISSRSVLSRWIRQYTSHSELKDTGKGLSKTMTKGRKTTAEERIEIAQNCLANGRNYQATAEKFEVSYQQVYSWVKKFEADGMEGLNDRRGRTKPTAELTEEEKLKLRMQQMEREMERLRVENAFLKKLEEIERRR